MGMIKEKPSNELTEVYASTGISPSNGTGAKGIENHSPDETSTGDKISATSTGTSTGTGSGSAATTEELGHKEEIGGMNPQEKGEKIGSGESTHTPQSMVYEPTPGTSTTTTSEGEAPLLKGGARHKSLMLSPTQIPLLKEVFDLRPGEVLDVTRAVEQADLRAKAIDRRNGGK
jgi:hypothetical protein